MDKKQKMAIILLPLLAIVLVAGGMFLKQQASTTPSAFVDGIYEGVGQGFNGDIKVAVTIASGKISGIELVEINDTPGLGDNAANKIIEAVIAAQNAEVDMVSGATKSSEGTIQAIKAALALASGSGAYPDGTYEGVAAGFNGDIKVKVVVAGGKIDSIELVEINDTPGLGDNAANKIIEAILETQSLDVDVVSGATKSSEGTIAAVKNALGLGDAEEASVPEEPVTELAEIDITALENGVYTAAAEGFKGAIELSVTVQDGKITKIEVVSQQETPSIGDTAINAIIDQVVSSQNVNADIVTGATYSSEGAIKAIIAALEGTPAPIETAEATTEPAKEEPAKEEPKKEEPKKEEPKKEEPKKETPAPTPTTPTPAPTGFKDGTYKASSNDSFYGDPINVTVTVKDGKITNVAVTENETPDIGGKAAKTIASQIVSKQSANVDVVSGATITSEAVIKAAKAAIDQAK